MPKSLWAHISPPAPDTETGPSDFRVDVAIVGAGYTGLSAAIHLAAAGVRVAVLEAAEAGWGASGRNGGYVIPGLKMDPDAVETLLGPERGKALVKWSGTAPDLVFDLIDKWNIACSPVRNGWCQPAYTNANLRTIEARCAQWAARGANVQMVDAASLPRLLGTPRYLGAWIDRRGGSINPLAYSRGLARAAMASGARLFTRTPALEINRIGASWAVMTPNATITAGHVLVATGAYADGLVPGLRRTIVPVRIGEVATNPLTDDIATTILPHRQAVSDSRRLLTSFRITPDRRLMMGGSTATAGLESVSIRDSLHRAARDLFGHLGGFEWDFFWSGVFSVTRDRIPHLHEPEPNLFASVGCNGRGIAISTAIGRMLAERVLGRHRDDLELPISTISPMAFHGMHAPVVRVRVGWDGVKDRFDRAVSRL